MKTIEKKKIGNKKVMPFTIPSGIVTTEVSCLERIAREIPELGILTTKSIGPEPRAGNREPIFAQYSPGCFVNAVGLTNPGAEGFAKKLSLVNLPEDKFLLASIFGKDLDEFVYVAKTLENCVDGFELNLSCPHARGYGMQLGQDSEIVHDITKAIVGKTSKPVFAKLTPNVNNIGEIALAAMNAGAYGLVAINTVGPGYYSINGFPILTNKVGGLSGGGISPIGVKCVKDITKKLGNIPIIGMGGISTAKDVEAYADAGALFFGVGSALVGMSEREIKNYFHNLVEDLGSTDERNRAQALLKKVNMEYKKAMITGKIEASGDFMKAMVTREINENCDFKIIRTNKHICAEPGQFVFAWIPGVGEKPFSVMDDSPLTLGILERGEFTRKINSLKKRDFFYFRGPYGQSLKVPDLSSVVLVGGGCGIAGLYFLAKKFSKKARVISLLAAKDKEHIPFIKEFEKYSEVRITTENGSLGRKGLVTNLFENSSLKQESYFFNCGPKAMVEAVLPLELKVSAPEIIYSSIDYITRCGVGICGSCADEKGKRTCVEGPFMNQ